MNKRTYGAAGNLLTDFRTVKRGGIIIFDGNHYQEERLIHYVGERVFVKEVGMSAFSNGPIDVYNERNYRICTVESQYDKDKEQVKKANAIYRQKPFVTKVWMAMQGFDMELLKRNWTAITTT